MYDAGKIVPGLVLFAAAVTFPVWLNVARGTPAGPPKLERPAGWTRCVLPTATMRATHMELLNRWRDRAIRQGQRVFTTADGRRFVRSLSGTCLGCHRDKKAFCDRCHTFMDVTPYCWNCHLAPEPSRSAPPPGGAS